MMEFRIEGRGSAVIRGVSSYKSPLPTNNTLPPSLRELQRKLSRANESLNRATKIVESVNSYMTKLNFETMDISKLGSAMEAFDTTGQTWEEKIYSLEREIEELTMEIGEKESEIGQADVSKRLRGTVVIDLIANEEGNVELILNYSELYPFLFFDTTYLWNQAVSHANWSSIYEVRIDSNDPSSRAIVAYKASIGQETGEVGSFTFIGRASMLISNRIGKTYLSRWKPVNLFSEWSYQNLIFGMSATRRSQQDQAEVSVAEVQLDTAGLPQIQMTWSMCYLTPLSLRQKEP